MRIFQKIAGFLDKLFNIRPAERPRVLLMFLMVTVSTVGTVWGMSITYAAFLTQVGLGALPWVLVLSSLFSILGIAIYTPFVDRMANDKLMAILYAVSIASIILGLVLLRSGRPEIAYPVMYLLVLARIAVSNPHFVTYVNSFYDIQSAKRIYPVIAAGFRTGSIIAGLTMTLLTTWFTPDEIIVIWLLSYVVAIGVIWLMPYFLKEKSAPSHQSPRSLAASAGSEKQPASYINSMREGFAYTTQSTFLRWMAIGTLVLMVLMALVEYRSSGLLSEIYTTPEELAGFIALLEAVGNIIVLPMLLFGISRLIARLGLGNTGLIYPAGNLLICGGLIFAPSLGSATAAYFDRTTLRVVFQFPIDALFYNAVPLRVRGRARAFASGLIVPVGSLIGGLLLLLPLTSTIWFVPAFIGVLAVAYLASAFVIRRQYSQALIEMLEQEDYSFLLLQEASDLTVADPATLNQLQKRLEASDSPEFTIFMAQLISQVGGNQAIPILSQAARTAATGRTRASVINVLIAANTRGEAVYQLYTDFLADADGQVRQSAIAGLEQVAGPQDRQFITRMLELARDPDIDVRVRALSALVHAGDFYRLAPAVAILNQLLTDENPHQRAYGVRVLGQIGYYRAIQDLAEYLADPADEVRLEAIVAIEALSQDKLPRLKARGSKIGALLAEKTSPLLQDPVERVRQAAVVVLGRLGERETHQHLAEALADASPPVRATAADMLVQIGKASIPTVHPLLDSPDPQLRKMAAIILSRINRREFGPLINTHISGNLLTIYHNYSYLTALAVFKPYQSMAVLQDALRDQNQQLTDEIFYLLMAIHEPQTIKTITDSLQSDVAHVRANAVEALETLTSPETARLIGSLFEPDLPPTQLLDLGKDAWDIADPEPATAVRKLINSAEMPWLRAIMAYALGEIGAGLQSQEIADQPPPAEMSQPKARKRRRGPADLLGVLDDIGDSGQKEHKPPADIPIDAAQHPLTLTEIETMLAYSLEDPVDNVKLAGQLAKQMIRGQYTLDLGQKEAIVLSVIEKIIFLKEVPFFEGMTVNQLEVLANVCEEELFEEDERIFDQGDPGGVLYVVVSGKVGIEREGTRKGSYVRLATLESHAYFGEMTLFDNSPRSAMAVALQDSLILSVRREPLIDLARQNPDLSLELINVLSQRLRESNDQIAKLSRTRPRELQKLFDRLD